MIKQLSEILKIGIFNIDTHQYIDRFNENVIIDNSMGDSITRAFRANRKNLDSNRFDYWYYELIQMYKNMFGCDIFVCKQTQHNGVRRYMYCTLALRLV